MNEKLLNNNTLFFLRVKFLKVKKLFLLIADVKEQQQVMMSIQRLLQRLIKTIFNKQDMLFNFQSNYYVKNVWKLLM